MYHVGLPASWKHVVTQISLLEMCSACVSHFPSTFQLEPCIEKPYAIIFATSPGAQRACTFFSNLWSPHWLHDHVVHQKKKLMKNGRPVKKNGKCVWLLPKYTRKFVHTVPNTNRKITCMGGTQIIDRFWRHLRSFLRNRAFAVGSNSLAIRVKSAQWTYWHRNESMWKATGHLLRKQHNPITA